jgi:hypothetical protein
LLKSNPSDNVRQRLIASLIGPEAAADFESFFVVARDVTPIADIVASPDTAPLPTQIGLLHAVTSALASYATRDNFAAHHSVRKAACRCLVKGNSTLSLERRDAPQSGPKNNRCIYDLDWRKPGPANLINRPLGHNGVTLNV